MKRNDQYESEDIEDRRGQSAPVGGGGGGLGLLLELVMRFGWKGGLDMFGLVAGARFLLGGGLGASTATSHQVAAHDSERAFMGYVLDDVQKTWGERIPGYRHARMVLYSDATTTGCGLGQAAVGPFYCPRDEEVYLDVTFFRELRNRLGAPGDFAQAYVVAHELGHHVQKLTGTSAKVEAAPQSLKLGEHGMSVRLELQADCYAGVWAASAEKRRLLDPGDIEQAITAAAAVGDDRLQKQATGTVQPERWTHGSSAERAHWFKVGRNAGDARACNTFR
jgi:predicted metalloprotease